MKFATITLLLIAMAGCHKPESKPSEVRWVGNLVIAPPNEGKPVVATHVSIGLRKDGVVVWRTGD